MTFTPDTKGFIIIQKTLFLKCFLNFLKIIFCKNACFSLGFKAIHTAFILKVLSLKYFLAMGEKPQ